jgi:hypothetical protein
LYGSIAQESQMVKADITIDDGLPHHFSPSTPIPPMLHQQKIYSVDILEQGKHKLVATLNNNGTLILDHIIVQGGNVSEDGNRGRQPSFVVHLSLICRIICRAVCRAFLTGLAVIGQQMAATNGRQMKVDVP